MSFDLVRFAEEDQLTINMLGDLEVIRNGELVELPPSKKTRAVLAFLAHTPKQRRRERLCGMFWEIPDDPRGALRWSLSKIRQIVKDRLEADRNSVRLKTDHLETDVQLLAGLHQANVEQASTEVLEAAAAAFRGPFLADLHLPRCPEFDAWRVAIADEMELLRMRILSVLIDRHADNPQRALSHAHALQTLQPDDEVLATRIELLGRQARDAVGFATHANTVNHRRDDTRIHALADSVASEGDSDIGTDRPENRLSDRFRMEATVLAMDLVSPIELLAEQDPESGEELLRPVYDRIEEILQKYSAVIVEAGNGGVVAAFGIENRTEDHAFIACRATIEISRDVESLASDFARLRACLDIGEIVARRSGGHESGWVIRGSVLRRARRAAESLPRNGMVLSRQARIAAGGYIVAEKLEDTRLPIFGSDQSFFELKGEAQAPSRWRMRTDRLLNTLYERDIELATLQVAWRRAQSGNGIVMGIVADAGVGKSRLTHEFCSAIAEHGARVLEYGALEPDRYTSYQTLRKIVGGLCQIDGCCDVEIAGERLTRLMDKFAIDDIHRPALEFLVSIPHSDGNWDRLTPDERARRIVDASRALIAGNARLGPLVVLIEDVHWMDAESNHVLRKFADALAEFPVLMIVTYRPVYRAEFLSRNHCQQLRINRFSALEMEGLISTLIGSDPDLETVRHALVRQNDGTPLFVEEALRSLVETGVIAGNEGNYRLIGDFEGLSIPSTVHSLISARIARLDPDMRTLVQIAAVIGREVNDDLLMSLSGFDEHRYRAAVDGLIDNELLYEVQSHPTLEYTFKHALNRRVAYGMLLSHDRQELHARILAALEKRYGSQRKFHAETLAEHAFDAGIWDKAAGYLMLAAGNSAMNSGTLMQARFLEKAVRAARQIPEEMAREAMFGEIAELLERLGMSGADVSAAA